MVTHMLKCALPEMIFFKKDFYDKIYNWLIEQETHPTLLEMIRAALSRSEILIPSDKILFCVYKKISKLNQI